MSPLRGWEVNQQTFFALIQKTIITRDQGPEQVHRPPVRLTLASLFSGNDLPPS